MVEKVPAEQLRQAEAPGRPLKEPAAQLTQLVDPVAPWNLPAEQLAHTVAPLADGIKMIKRMEDGAHFGKIVLRA